MFYLLQSIILHLITQAIQKFYNPKLTDSAPCIYKINYIAWQKYAVQYIYNKLCETKDAHQGQISSMRVKSGIIPINIYFP
jgi:hypothetical protein